MAYQKFRRAAGMSYGAAKSLVTRAVRAGRRSARYVGRKSKSTWIWWLLGAVVLGAVYYFRTSIMGLFAKKPM